MIHVIVPVYNATKYLRDTVCSVLAQPYKDINIVLVDDGSTDGSFELCDKLAKEEKCITVIHQKNGGVSAARNKGIEYVLNVSNDNDYLAFLDADDLWNKNVFTKNLVRNFQEDTEIDVYIFGGISCNENCSRFTHPRIYEESCFDGGNSVIWKAQGHFCANLYHIRMFRKWGIRFREGLKYSEDKIFMMQCVFLAEKVRFMPEMLHIYRQNNNSVMEGSKFVAPVDYYVPIIDGWIDSDLFLNGFEDVTNKTTDAGFVLSSIYFMDMAMDHYKRWHNPKELNSVKSHPYYYLFENMKPNCVSSKQYKNCKLLMNYPILYRLKYNAIGVVEFIIRWMIKCKPFYNYRMKKKYPLLEIPSEEILMNE